MGTSCVAFTGDRKDHPFCSRDSGDGVGTGGGFPGIPLAILFPEVNFYLIDSIGKKIKVVEGIRDALGLQHVRTEQIRVENVAEQQDFIVSRAVTAFPAFVN